MSAMAKDVIENPLDKLPEYLQKDLERNLCVCNDVPRGVVINAIANGAKTVEEVREKTWATTGIGCCRRQVDRLIEYLWAVRDE